MSDLQIVLLIFVVNAVLAIAYLIFSLITGKEENRAKFIIQTIFMLMCPLIGMLFLVLSQCVYAWFFKAPIDRDNISFSKERVKTIVAPDEEKELNIVPLEEALVVTGKKGLRRLLLDVLKDDKEGSLRAISMSLSSDDSETSHYAASIMMDVLSQFRKEVSEFQEKLKNEEEYDEQIAVDLISYILNYVSQQIFSSMEEHTYLVIAYSTAEVLYQKNPEAMDPPLYLSLVEALLNISEVDIAQKWASRLSTTYGDMLETFVANIKVCYVARDRDSFFLHLERLKASKIPITSEILALIKMFE